MQSIHPLVHYFISQGVPLDTIIMLLMFPIIATVIAFLRQIVGVKAFGIYTPSIVTFAFLAIGIKYGIAIFFSIIFVGMITRYVLKFLRLLYLPRVAITLTIVSFSLLLILVFGGYFQRTGLANVSIFPLLIMITIVEKFVSIQTEKGTKTALSIAFITLAISLVGFFIGSWSLLKEILISYPWIIILTIPANVIIGKWTGLRVIEYLRFRKIIERM